ncbi:MAG: NAD(P)/FAD-dependent oxidoreductase [Fuerstiella sp.]
MNDRVIVIGAGLAGLCCAKRLNDSGVACTVLEAADRVGGRVATDEVDGFLLDRGFQVLLTAYPECRDVLNYEELNLQAYDPGAMVRVNDSFDVICDPWRSPSRLIKTALSKVGSLGDKLKIQTLRRQSRVGTIDDLFDAPEQTTFQSLKTYGFSDQMIDRFFRPFLGGVFLDQQLETSSRMLHFVFRMFSDGLAAVPSEGMQAVPTQIAQALPDGTVQLNQSVVSTTANTVTISSGEVLPAKAVVLATDQHAAGNLAEELKVARQFRRVRCLYFHCNEAPVAERLLVLNGNQQGPINNLSVPSQISSSYAPNGQHLVSVTTLDESLSDADIETAVRNQLTEWFGSVASDWKHLRTYDIPHALPNHSMPAFEPTWHPQKLNNGIYVCGDYRSQGSIQGAMVSGRLTADSVIAACS